MVVINNIDNEKFSFNGVNYYKNFTPKVIKNKIEVLNTYDSSIRLTDYPTLFSDFTVDGNTFASVELLQDALLPVIYSRNSLNGLDNVKYFYHEETNQWTLNTNKNIIKPSPIYGYKNTNLATDSGLTDPLSGIGVLQSGNGTASFCKLPFSDLKLKKIFLTSRNSGSVNSFRLLVVSGTRLNNAGFASQYSSTNIIYDEIITGFSNESSINLEIDLPSPSVITDDEVYIFYAYESGAGSVLYALKTGLLFEE